MRRIRNAVVCSAAALLLGVSVVAGPVSAQRARGCGQQISQVGEQTFTFTNSNRSHSEQDLIGVINAAIQNVQATVPVTVQNLGANVSVVCLTDTLNGNDIRILNGILNNVDVLNDAQFLNGVNVLSDVNILSVDTGSNTIYVVPR